ncbi:hypothetical protein ACLI09_02365 [Flavobacterium sp. RHBU_24]|uniref:hypothetical protein n=1 Tax=Flavobacterium sp. RHBU_24 TaxID=3391185 RepID=UPI00398567DC
MKKVLFSVLALIAMSSGMKAASLKLSTSVETKSIIVDYVAKTNNIVLHSMDTADVFGCRYWYIIYDRDRNIVDAGVWTSSSSGCVQEFTKFLWESTPEGGSSSSGI